MLPIIDIAELTSRRIEDRRKVAIAIRAACIECGFFYVTNHGVPADLIAETFEQSARFFDQPLAKKQAVAIDRSPVSRGYEPIGAQSLDLAAAPDQKESFYIGIERGIDDPLVAARTHSHGSNQWPAGGLHGGLFHQDKHAGRSAVARTGAIVGDAGGPLRAHGRQSDVDPSAAAPT